MMCAQSGNRGFTLIEVAVVTVVAGILMAGALIGIPQYLHNEQAKETRARMDLVMNALSVYSQRNLRLPCPAVTTGDLRGTEIGGGKCYRNENLRELYDVSGGVVPWKALGLSERDVMDGWGRYITYKPAPHLTVETGNPAMQPGADGRDVHNACRTKLWFDDAGTNHIDRQKALFCCNSMPKSAYLTELQNDGEAGLNPATAEDVAARLNAIVPAAGGDADALDPFNDPVVSTNRWIDDYAAKTPAAAGSEYYLSGSFLEIFNTDADAPLLRASGHAVTLISHGGNGIFSPLRNNDGARLESTAGDAGTAPISDSGASADERRNIWPPDIFSASLFHPKASATAYDRSSLRRGASDDLVSWARSDQLFARTGDATCVRPPVILSKSEENCSNYGNFIYILDSSTSMEADFDGALDRISVAKQVLPEVIALHIAQESRDTDPDAVGFTRLTWNGGDDPLIKLSAENVILNPDFKIDSQENIDRATATAQSLVAETEADGWTPLFDTILQSAAIANDPKRTDPKSGERTALLIVSDGYDNKSGMGTNCREGYAPDFISWCDRSWAATRKAEDKETMLRTLNSKYLPSDKQLDISAIEGEPGYSEMTREALFGKILAQLYPNMDVHIVDMSVTDDNRFLSDLQQLVSAVGGGSTFSTASDTEDLREKLTSVCRKSLVASKM